MCCHQWDDFGMFIEWVDHRDAPPTSHQEVASETERADVDWEMAPNVRTGHVSAAA